MSVPTDLHGLVCLFPGCELIFADHISLNYHQRSQHSHTIIPSFEYRTLLHRAPCTPLDPEPGYGVTHASHANTGTTTSDWNASYYTARQDSQMRHDNKAGSGSHSHDYLNRFTKDAQQCPSQMFLSDNFHPASPRYYCSQNGCNVSVTRRCDLNRHMLTTHQTGLKAFDCPSPTCERKGVNGFPRRDKVRDHCRAVH